MIFKCIECGEDVEEKDYPKQAFFGMFRPRIHCGNCQTIYIFEVEDKASILERFVLGCSLLYILVGVIVAGGTNLLFSIPITIPFIFLAIVLSHHNYGLRLNKSFEEDNWECLKCHEQIRLKSFKNNTVHSCPTCNLTFTFVKTPKYPKRILIRSFLIGSVGGVIIAYIRNDLIVRVAGSCIIAIWLLLYIRRSGTTKHLSIHISEK